MHSKSRRLAGLETWREAKWHKWHMFPCHHLIHIDTSSFLLNLPSATWIHSCDIHAFATTSVAARASEAWQVHKKAMLEKVKDLPVETSVGHSVWGLFPCSFFCSSTTERHNHQLSFCCCYTSCSRKAFVIIRAHRFVVFTGFVPVSCTFGPIISWICTATNHPPAPLPKSLSFRTPREKKELNQAKGQELDLLPWMDHSSITRNLTPSAPFHAMMNIDIDNDGMIPEDPSGLLQSFTSTSSVSLVWKLQYLFPKLRPGHLSLKWPVYHYLYIMIIYFSYN